LNHFQISVGCFALIVDEVHSMTARGVYQEISGWIRRKKVD
jgi:hypothetical protein